MEIRRGNIFESETQALINPVNIEGVMGKGLAYQFKKKYPDNFEKYKQACLEKKIDIGKDLIYTEEKNNIKYSLEKGDFIDKLVFSGVPENIEYIYFKIGNKIYDIKYIDGKYSLSIKSESLVINGDEEIIFKKNDDNRYYKSKVKEEKNK